MKKKAILNLGQNYLILNKKKYIFKYKISLKDDTYAQSYIREIFIYEGDKMINIPKGEKWYDKE